MMARDRYRISRFHILCLKCVDIVEILRADFDPVTFGTLVRRLWVGNPIENGEDKWMILNLEEIFEIAYSKE